MVAKATLEDIVKKLQFQSESWYRSYTHLKADIVRVCTKIKTTIGEKVTCNEWIWKELKCGKFKFSKLANKHTPQNTILIWHVEKWYRGLSGVFLVLYKPWLSYFSNQIFQFVFWDYFEDKWTVVRLPPKIFNFVGK